MNVPFEHVLVLAGLVFMIGMFCVVARQNLIMILLGLEVMLNASAIAFIGAALKWQNLDGQAMAIFIIAIAAAEVSIGLALVVAVYRKTGTIASSCIDTGTCDIEGA